MTSHSRKYRAKWVVVKIASPQRTAAHAAENRTTFGIAEATAATVRISWTIRAMKDEPAMNARSSWPLKKCSSSSCLP